MDESRILKTVADLRRELGYDRPAPPQAPELPEWLQDFLKALGKGISGIIGWIAEGGWRILVPVLVIFCGVVVWLLVRKVPGRQKVSEAPGDEKTGAASPDAILPADQWLDRAEAAAEAGDASAAILYLYRGGLQVCLKKIRPDGEKTNREIRLQIPREWRDPFEQLYLAAEPILFDDRDGSPDEYRRLRSVYQEGFR